MGPVVGFRFSRLTIAASLCVALLAAGCASAVPGPSSTKPQAETFVSDRYGFSITLPTGTPTGHAAAGWDASCICNLDNPAWDYASLGERTLVVGATAVDSGMDLARWRARILEIEPAYCHDSEAATAVTIGGEDALEGTVSCSDATNGIEVAALHGGRRYLVLFASPSSDGLADNQTAFDSIMSSFKYVGS